MLTLDPFSVMIDPSSTDFHPLSTLLSISSKVRTSLIINTSSQTADLILLDLTSWTGTLGKISDGRKEDPVMPQINDLPKNRIICEPTFLDNLLSM